MCGAWRKEGKGNKREGDEHSKMKQSACVSAWMHDVCSLDMKRGLMALLSICVACRSDAVAWRRDPRRNRKNDCGG